MRNDLTAPRAATNVCTGTLCVAFPTAYAHVCTGTLRVVCPTAYSNVCTGTLCGVFPYRAVLRPFITNLIREDIKAAQRKRAREKY